MKTETHASPLHSPIDPVSYGSVAFRLFLTCWIVYCLHFATNFVREHYLALTLAERGSFRMDEFLGFMPETDIIEVPGYGVHIGGNPGGSMVAAISLAPFMPAINRINAIVQQRRSHQDLPEIPEYDDPRPNRQAFYRKVWQQGLDIKFGLIEVVTHVFCSAVWSAVSAIVILRILEKVGLNPSQALFYSLFYAFATPVFFRTGHLTHNLLAGHFALFSFALVFFWWQHDRIPRAMFGSGFFAGMTILIDYSGVPMLLCLAGYALYRRASRVGVARAIGELVVFGLGAAIPVGLLMFYQYRAFGNAILPPQHHMPRPVWLPAGYPKSGFGPPTFDLLWRTLLDVRYGLFAYCPVLILGVYGLIRFGRQKRLFALPDRIFFVAFSVALWLFFSSTQYTIIQWNTGLRYLLPVVPFLFLGTAEVMYSWPRRWVYMTATFMFTLSWCVAMVRESVTESLVRVMTTGFQLPWLTVLKKMAPQYLGFLEQGTSPLPLLLLSVAVICLIWYPDFVLFAMPRRSSSQTD
jgi:hypothetical protein